MDIYHIWCDLRPGEHDLTFAAAVSDYLESLRVDGRIVGYRLARKKLGLAPSDLGEFHIEIEVRDLGQLESAFQSVSTRADPVESLHHAVNSRVVNFRAALYRDFPDAHRVRGQERF